MVRKPKGPPSFVRSICVRKTNSRSPTRTAACGQNQPLPSAGVKNAAGLPSLLRPATKRMEASAPRPFCTPIVLFTIAAPARPPSLTSPNRVSPKSQSTRRGLSTTEYTPSPPIHPLPPANLASHAGAGSAATTDGDSLGRASSTQPKSRNAIGSKRGIREKRSPNIRDCPFERDERLGAKEYPSQEKDRGVTKVMFAP